jgi:hypothetical protein
LALGIYKVKVFPLFVRKFLTWQWKLTCFLFFSTTRNLNFITWSNKITNTMSSKT